MKSLRHRLPIAARILGAVVGSYGVATVLAVALARLLPLRPPEAVVTATIVATLAMPAAAIWMFGARTAKRGWIGIMIVAGLALALAWMAGPPA